MLAIQNSQPLDMIQDMVESGSDVNARELKAWTALHFGVYEENLESVRYLLTQRTDFQAATREGNNVLHLCAKSNEGVEVVECLLEHAKTALGEKDFKVGFA